MPIRILREANEALSNKTKRSAGCLTHLKPINQSRRVYGEKKTKRKRKKKRKPKTALRARALPYASFTSS
jgi:hypothetical protein